MDKTQKNKVSPIDCDEAARRFSDFMDNYIKGKAKVELMQHIADCRHCFERIEFEQMLKAKVSAMRKATSIEKKAAKRNMEEMISKIYSA